MIKQITITNEPSSYKEAIKDNRWIKAIVEEMADVNLNNIEVLTDLPPSRKPIGSRWIYNIKYKANGEIGRFKARLYLRVLVN